MNSIKLRNPVIVALDFDDESKTLSLAKEIGSQVGALKIGPRLTMRFGPQLIKKLADIAPVFVDHKYFDIPSTMEGAIKASFEAGASLVTVHTLAGVKAIQPLVKLEAQLTQQRPFQLLGVTILTSFAQDDLATNLVDKDIDQHVYDLVSMSYASGLKGFVSSPHEADLLRKKFPDIFLVTPGVRMSTDKADDQSRTMTPSEAINAGASALVIGRPIIAAEDPKLVLKNILKDLGHS